MLDNREKLRMRKTGLPLVVDENTEILILGTLPSDASLAAGQYYANPRNDFWGLIGAALNQNFGGLPYEDKIAILKTHHIGLWDAYHTCRRPGSMDMSAGEHSGVAISIVDQHAPRP